MVLWGYTSSFWDTVVRWAFVISLIAGGMTAISLYVSGWVGYRLADAVQKDADTRIADAKRDTAAALQRIAELNKETTRLSADAEASRAAIAESKAREKEAELKLAQLEKKVTPRVIDDEQAAKIVEKINPFAGTPFAVESDSASEYGFVNRVIAVIQRSGWNWRSYSVSPMSLPPGDLGDTGIALDQISGVQVRINASRLSDFRKPAEALAYALTQALQASVSIVFDPPDSPHACSPDVIHIEIRRKL